MRYAMNRGVFLCIALSCSFGLKVHAQCYNSSQFPDQVISVSQFASVVTTISNDMRTGRHCVVNNLVSGRSYTVNSSDPGDFVTVRTNGGLVSDTALSYGVVPHTFVASSHVHELHINLSSPACGYDGAIRTLTISCNDCQDEPVNVGVNAPDPTATLDVDGKVKLADDSNPAEAGMIRFNSANQDFEGYNGDQWVSLTRTTSTWGNQPVSNEGVENLKLLASDGDGGDRFGWSVAIDGDYAIVGAPSAGFLALGAAYIFVRNGNTWNEQAKLTADDAQNFDQFGWSVAIDGDYVIVGSYGDNIGSNNDQGSAYIFVRSDTTWAQQAKLTAADGAAGDQFGYSVGISGDYALIGAHLDDIGSTADWGSAYMFKRSGTSWSQENKFTQSIETDNSRQLGYRVSIDGDYAIVGAPFYANGFDVEDLGAAYVYHLQGSVWEQQTIFTNGVSVGLSVGISGDRAAVYNNFIIDVYLRSGEDWSLETTTGGTTSLSLDGDYMAGGFPANEVDGNLTQGLATVRKREGTSWSTQVTAIASDGESGDELGTSVSVSGNVLIAGAPFHDDGANSDRGAAYIFIRNN